MSERAHVHVEVRPRYVAERRLRASSELPQPDRGTCALLKSGTSLLTLARCSGSCGSERSLRLHSGHLKTVLGYGVLPHGMQ